MNGAARPLLPVHNAMVTSFSIRSEGDPAFCAKAAEKGEGSSNGIQTAPRRFLPSSRISVVVPEPVKHFLVFLLTPEWG